MALRTFLTNLYDAYACGFLVEGIIRKRDPLLKDLAEFGLCEVLFSVDIDTPFNVNRLITQWVPDAMARVDIIQWKHPPSHTSVIVYYSLHAIKFSTFSETVRDACYRFADTMQYQIVDD